jgi:hypothetical protein
MYAENAETMQRFLEQLVVGGDFADVPMRDDVRFTGPLASATTADGYRSICGDFATSVHGIAVRSMVGDDTVVHVVYDVDMGLATGPLATSQTVEFVAGAFASVEVIFDAAVITGVAA